MIGVLLHEQRGISGRAVFAQGTRNLFLCLALLFFISHCTRAASASDGSVPAPGVLYTNHRTGDGPWSIHIVKVPWSKMYEIHTMHAGRKALGLSTLRAQVESVNPALGEPVAAINGDFYKRDKAYAGAPRGLQILEGEVLSAPANEPVFWVDVLGEPHTTNVVSLFQITWPDGTVTPFGLNGERQTNRGELYTPAIGASTHTTGGRELVLERNGTSRWLPLQTGRMYPARVREIRQAGDNPLAPDIMVLSLGPEMMDRFQKIKPGDVLQISTATEPRLLGIRTAISGGPMLILNGKRQKIKASPSDAYGLSSMLEQHPRAAIGWNKGWFFLVEVDGRQRDLSVGMTLDELSKYMANLGCEQAINLDGGGSATLWYDGDVRNSPCDGYERTLANSVVIVRKSPGHATPGPTASK